MVNNKFYRFMSAEEFSALASGVTLRNDTVWGADPSRNASVGFCFFAEEIKTVDAWPGERRELEVLSVFGAYWDFVTGIVSNDVLVEFSVPEGKLNKSFAAYAGHDIFRDRLVREYCTCQYSRYDFVPVRAMVGFSRSWHSQWIDLDGDPLRMYAVAAAAPALTDLKAPLISVSDGFRSWSFKEVEKESGPAVWRVRCEAGGSLFFETEVECPGNFLVEALVPAIAHGGAGLAAFSDGEVMRLAV